MDRAIAKKKRIAKRKAARKAARKTVRNTRPAGRWKRNGAGAAKRIGCLVCLGARWTCDLMQAHEAELWKQEVPDSLGHDARDEYCAMAQEYYGECKHGARNQRQAVKRHMVCP